MTYSAGPRRATVVAVEVVGLQAVADLRSHHNGPEGEGAGVPSR